ncbi:MAG: hypothetical protein M1838_003832 [Thelocarpon superellum]|nr:MAG: hypothetical protein M1838_003832 [Thelocarpon superellum]
MQGSWPPEQSYAPEMMESALPWHQGHAPEHYMHPNHAMGIFQEPVYMDQSPFLPTTNGRPTNGENTVGDGKNNGTVELNGPPPDDSRAPDPPPFGLDGTHEHAVSQQPRNPTIWPTTSATRTGSTSNTMTGGPTSGTQGPLKPHRPAGVENPADLNTLKAKVKASIERTRAENSSTPNKESSQSKVGPTSRPESTSDGHERALSSSQRPTGRKDSSTDIDGLLAEGKALADRHVSGEKPRQSPAKTPQDRSPTKTRGAAKASENPAQTARPVLNRSTSSSLASEQGELRDERSLPSRARRPSEVDERRGRAVRTEAADIAQDISPLSQEPTSHVRPQVNFQQPSTRNESAKDQEAVQVRKSSTRSLSQPGRGASGVSRSAHDPGTVSERRPSRTLEILPEPAARMYEEVIMVENQGRPRLRVDPNHHDSSRRPSEARQVIEIYDNEAPQHSSRSYPSIERRYVDDGAHVARANLGPGSHAELEEWLEMTGYYDRHYRTETLQRHRKKMAIEVAKAELAREEAELAREAQQAQEQRIYYARTSSMAPRDDFDVEMSGTTPLARTSRASSVFAMPPPPVPVRLVRRALGPLETSPDMVAARSDGSDDSPPARSQGERSGYHRPTQTISTAHANQGYLKRPHERNEDLDLPRPSAKVLRVEQGRPGDSTGSAAEGSPRENVSPGGHMRVVRPSNSTHERRGEDAAMRSLDVMDMTRSPRRASFHDRSDPVLTRQAPDRSRSLSPAPRGDGQAELEGSSRDALGDRLRSQAGPEQVSPSSSPQRGGYEGGERGPARPQGGPGGNNYKNYVRQRPYDDGYGGPDSHHGNERFGNERYVNDRFGSEPHRSSSQPTRGRGRGGSFPHRGDSRPVPYRGPRYGRQDHGGERLDLYRDTRFFIVKSFNYSNVEKAEEENVWVTQEKNEEMLADAFQRCRNVILLFSINKSMAFQGYARMESAPGTAAPPSWAKGLHWRSSGAFRIRWITLAETRFSRVGHLKNAFNEYQAVLIGRDGQEIEGECGAALCGLIDEEADRPKF